MSRSARCGAVAVWPGDPPVRSVSDIHPMYGALTPVIAMARRAVMAGFDGLRHPRLAAATRYYVVMDSYNKLGPRLLGTGTSRMLESLAICLRYPCHCA